MAQLSGTQKKQQKTFIALLVAIVVVVVAIAYVLFGALTSKSSLLDNQDFAAALSENLGKAPAFIKEEDLAAVRYLGLFYDADGKQVQVMTAGDDFASMYIEYMEKTEAEEDVSSYDFTGLYKSAAFDAKEAPRLDDLKYFTGVQVIEVSGITVSDSSVFAGMKSLVLASVSCGLTEVNGFTGLNADTLKKLTLSGNAIEDWSALNYIEDKVIVSAYYTVEPGEDGTVDFNNFVYKEKTLAEQNAEAAAAAEASDEENSDETESEADADADTDETDTAVDADAAADENADTDAVAEVVEDADAALTGEDVDVNLDLTDGTETDK